LLCGFGAASGGALPPAGPGEGVRASGGGAEGTPPSVGPSALPHAPFAAATSGANTLPPRPTSCRRPGAGRSRSGRRHGARGGLARGPTRQVGKEAGRVRALRARTRFESREHLSAGRPRKSNPFSRRSRTRRGANREAHERPAGREFHLDRAPPKSEPRKCRPGGGRCIVHADGHRTSPRVAPPGLGPGAGAACRGGRGRKVQVFRVLPG